MDDEIQAGEDGLYCVGFKNVYALDYQSIRDAFSQFGRTRTVRGACNGYDSGWTFVRFANPEEAVRAMTGMRESPHLCDPLYVRYVQDRPTRTSGRRQGAEVAKAAPISAGESPLTRRQDDRSPVRPPTHVEKCEVYIGNLPLDLEKSDVYQLLTKYEIQVVDVRLYKKEHKSFAFVVVPTIGDLDLAIKQLNGGKVAGRQIVVTNSRKSSQNGGAAEKPQQVVEAAPPAAIETAPPVAVETAPPVTVGVRQRLGMGGVAGGSGGVGQGWRGGRPAGPRPVAASSAAAAAAAATASRMPALMAPGPPPLVMPGPPPSVMSGPPPPLGADRFVPAGSPRQPPGRAVPPRFPGRPTGAGQFQSGQFQSGDLFDAHGNHFKLDASQFESAGGQYDGGDGGLSDGGARKAYPGGALSHFEPAGGRAPFPGDQRVRGVAHTAMRRSFDQRGDLDMGYEEPYAKRSRFGGDAADFQLQNGPPPLAGLGRTVTTGPPRPILSQMTPERRSSLAISERIKSRLHAPMEVVVANFPVGTNENDLMGMFAKYEPLNVRIMVNNSSQHPDDFTYAYVTLASRMTADEAVIEMDGIAFQGRPLVVETKKK